MSRSWWISIQLMISGARCMPRSAACAARAASLSASDSGSRRNTRSQPRRVRRSSRSGIDSGARSPASASAKARPVAADSRQRLYSANRAAWRLSSMRCTSSTATNFGMGDLESASARRRSMVSPLAGSMKTASGRAVSARSRWVRPQPAAPQMYSARPGSSARTAASASPLGPAI
ncbi:hypothetical protein D3C77_534720 [compost metagenome]